MTTYTTTQAPLPWMEPYLQDYASRAQGVANVPYSQSPTQAVGTNPTLDAAWQAIINRSTQGTPEMSAGRGQLTNTINGGFLGAQATANPYAQADNPYLSQSIANAQNDFTRSYNMMARPAWDRSMQQSGSFGNSGVMEADAYDRDIAARNLGRIGSDMRFQGYNTSAQLAESGAQRQDATRNLERSMMQQAMALAPAYANQDYVDAAQLTGVGNAQRGIAQDQARQQYQWWAEPQQLQQSQLDAYGRALGMNAGSTGTTTQPDPSTASQVLGGALTGAAIWRLLGLGG